MSGCRRQSDEVRLATLVLLQAVGEGLASLARGKAR